MKKMLSRKKLRLGLVSWLLLSVSFSFAQVAPLMKWTKVTYTGKGCPKADQGTVISPEGTSLSILFMGLSLEFPLVGDPSTQGDVRDLRGLVAGPMIGQTVFKSCNVSLEFQVPAGKYVESAAVSVDWRGGYLLDPGIIARLKTLVTYPEYRSGRLSRGSVALIDKRWTEGDEEFTLTHNQKVISALGCQAGNTQTIEFKHILLLSPSQRGMDNGATAILTTDSADTAVPSMDVDVVLKNCKK